MNILFKPVMNSIIFIAISLTLTISAQAQTTAPQAVEKIDIQKYLGQWYEISRLPMYFQRKCVADTTAQYQLNSNQTLSVLNSCRTENGEMISSEGVAYSQNQANSKLKVSFLPKGLRWLPFTKGDYWILRIDPEYKVALVGGPNHKYLWILSRDKKIDDSTYQSYLETAKHYGYDISQLIRTPHSD